MNISWWKIAVHSVAQYCGLNDNCTTLMCLATRSAFWPVSKYYNFEYGEVCDAWLFMHYIFSFICTIVAFSVLTLLVERQEGHLTCKKFECWPGGVVICLKWCAHYLHMVQLMPLSPHHHWNPDWFYLSGTGWPSLSWKRPLDKCLCARSCFVKLKWKMANLFLSLFHSVCVLSFIRKMALQLLLVLMFTLCWRYVHFAFVVYIHH